jgi:hypothetical protein
VNVFGGKGFSVLRALEIWELYLCEGGHFGCIGSLG